MKWITLGTFLLTLGCSHLTIDRSENSSHILGVVHEYTLETLLFGTIALDRLPPESEICPDSRVESITMNMKFVDVLTGLVSLGLGVPHRVTVTCSSALNNSH